MLTISLKISRNNWISLPHITPSACQKEPTLMISSLWITPTSTEPLMTDDAILCEVLDEEGSETEDDT